MKIFLDIGAHTGETLRVVTDPRWRFDRIYSFEPAPACWPSIRAVATPTVEVCEYGLWEKDAVLALHNAGTIGASTSADKEGEGETVDCRFRDAAAWFRDNLNPKDEIFAKINVEGAEAELVERLSDAGVLGYIDQLLIHFDVRKVPSKRHLEQQIRGQLHAAGVEYLSADQIQFGGVYRGTCNWLQWCHAARRGRTARYVWLPRLQHPLRKRLYPLKRALRPGLPSREAVH